MRPRANTISHIDEAQFQMMAAATAAVARNIHPGGHSHHPSLSGLPMNSNSFQYGGMSNVMGQRGTNHGLPKLDTNGFNTMNFGGGLRTAPAMGTFEPGFDFEGLVFGGNNTINPNALHYNDSPQSMALDPTSPFLHTFPDSNHNLDENFEWMNTFDHQISFDGTNENAIDGSSPSAISTASQSGISEVMLDGSNNPAATTSSMWQQSMMAPPLMTPNPFIMDMSPFPDYQNSSQLSPQNMSKNLGDQYFSTPPPSMNSMSSPSLPNLAAPGIDQTMGFGLETPESMGNGGQYQYSPISTITDLTRQSLLVTLSQPATFGATRKYSFSGANNSSLSPHFGARSNTNNESVRTLPSTLELQRYAGAYIHYFHPHLPFLHISTLTFEIPMYANNMRGQSSSGMIGGRGCLLLSMAAIGALYEGDSKISRELFELAKKMIQIYLEERRRADIRKADIRKVVPDHGQESSEHSPVWLVQAMLLNVVYGHNCGDKTASDIASTHCAALVSLARAAGLLHQQPRDTTDGQIDTKMIDDEMMKEAWAGKIEEDLPEDEVRWHKWKFAEERKRTLYAVFILSSLLVSAYNHTPALTNSEILLDLPCDEEFWSADSAARFQAMGDVEMANHSQVTFHDALGELLRAGEKQHQQNVTNWQMFGPNTNLNDSSSTSDLKPSTFGCLVLINALHNYIWETRQRHHNKIWTNEETEKMHKHIEPALQAWQAAWNSNPNHSVERPNPHGVGPLSADSVPLLDLAYVRLFVNLSRSKEKFWNRDFDGMAEELSRGSEIIQHAIGSPFTDSSSEPSTTSGSCNDSLDSPPTIGSEFGDFKGQNGDFKQQIVQPQAVNFQQPNTMSKRERHLRKAAFYAADSLSMADKFGVTFADFTSRELPLQSAMCAFDCAQVLAEWIATVQERVGRYVGILGKDDIDLTQVPSIMLLEEEDCKLLSKIDQILRSAESKMALESSGLVKWEMQSGNMNVGWENRLIVTNEGGYGAKILHLTAYMLEKAAVWPGWLPSRRFIAAITYANIVSIVTRLMAQSLQIQANLMKIRAEKSVMQRE